MPDRSGLNDSGGLRSFGTLFWLGVGLAPVAALMLLLADGSATLRVAAVVALLAAVLIGLSTARGSGRRSARPDLAQSLASQRDEIRGEVRTEVAVGVQAAHRMVGESLRPLRDEIEALRGQVDAIWAGAARMPEADHGSAGFAAAADAPVFSYDGGQEQAAVGIGVAAVPQPAPAGARASSGRATVPPRVAAPRAHVPTGVVRHTETVQVTTRQTIVEPDGDRSDAAYGSGYYGTAAGWTVPAQRRRSADREFDRATGGDREDVRVEPEGFDGDNDAAWTGARDNWATNRDEGGGREIRMGQRRARVRAGETGTELRFEDRWAAVRETAPEHHESHRGGWRSAGSWRDEHSSYPAGRDEAGDPTNSEGRPRWAGADDVGGRHDRGNPRDRWAEAGGREERPDRGADPAERGWNDGDRNDHGWNDGDRDDHGWNDRGWSESDHSWHDSDQGPEHPTSLDASWGQPVPALPAGNGAANSGRTAWAEPERQRVPRGHRYRDDSEAYGFPPSDGVPRAGGRQVGYERYDSRWG